MQLKCVKRSVIYFQHNMQIQEFGERESSCAVLQKNAFLNAVLTAGHS